METQLFDGCLTASPVNGSDHFAGDLSALAPVVENIVSRKFVGGGLAAMTPDKVFVLGNGCSFGVVWEGGRVLVGRVLGIPEASAVGKD